VEPVFAPNDVVQRINQPESIGIVLERRRDAQTNLWKYLVQFGTDHRVVPEERLRRLVVTQTGWEAL